MIFKRNKLAVAIVCVCSISVAPSVTYAGIPTVDVIGNTMEVLNQIETIAQWADQLNRMKDQLDQAKDQFESLNGIRGMASLLTSTSDRNYAAIDAVDLIKLGTGDLRDVEANRIHQTINQVTSIYNRSSKRFDQLQELIDNVDTNDPKAAMDLQNRISGEAVMLQNDIIKVQMASQMFAIKQQEVAQLQKEKAAQFGNGAGEVYASSY
jgi:type IV secretion system protein VirB5